jgi:putative transposase
LPRRNNDYIISVMPNYIRAKFEGGYYFFTVVTYCRKQLFTEETARNILRQAITVTQSRHPFEMIAICLLPEHLHCVWKLPEGDANFSIRWSSIKGIFSREYLRTNGQKHIPLSRADKGEVCLWQQRFWEHQIRDEKDLQRHIDYIHYNPVKHNLAESAENWPWSTYHQFLKEGLYGKFNDFKKVAGENVSDFGE